MTTTSTSINSSAYGIVKGLLAAEPEWLGDDRLWAASNSEQARFLEFINRCCFDATGLEEIQDVLASNSKEKATEWLNQNNIESVAPEIDAEKEIWIGVCSSFELGWEKPGRANSREIDGTKYDFVTMRDGFSFHAPPADWISPVSEQSTAPVNFAVRIRCANNMSLWLLMCDDEFGHPLDLMESIHKIRKDRCPAEKCAKPRLHFPMMDIQHNSSLDWLAGLSTQDENEKEWTVVGGIQNQTLKIDERGAPSMSTTTGVFTGGGGNRNEPPTEMIFDKPFVAWIEKHGAKDPLFVAHVTPEDWRRPAK